MAPTNSGEGIRSGRNDDLLPPEPQLDDNMFLGSEERELSLREINALVSQLRSSAVLDMVDRMKRIQFIQFCFLVALIVATGWVVFVQRQSGDNLQKSLYNSCTQGNKERSEQRRVYQDVAKQSDPSTDVAKTLMSAADRIQIRDCKKLYLDN